MKKVDNRVANNACDDVFFTESAKFKPKCIPVHGLNNLQTPVRYLTCEQRAARGQPGVRRCPCGRDVPLAELRADPETCRDPVSNITLAIGISLVICGLTTALLGVYGFLLKVRQALFSHPYILSDSTDLDLFGNCTP